MAKEAKETKEADDSHTIYIGGKPFMKPLNQ